ncbi:class I SAM-dependent methyltransferase [Actinopolymorpha sp. B9G3]|uniref:class I SAM-dependent methyltransferase n=1 Tax=Actinopolymorpha sp. B9G3 TaxID=3158970 RepID=UPI0032D8E254
MNGQVLVDLAWWDRPPDAVDDQVLRRCGGPTLDVGCGPGRMVVELARRGVPALGIDVVARAVRQVLARGGHALTRSVFDDLPCEGRWQTVLLLDGCVGIGGDPKILLARIRELLAPGGVAYIEHDPEPDRAEYTTARLRYAGGEEATVDWTEVGWCLLARVAGEVDLVVKDTWTAGGRSFAAFSRPVERSAEWS